MEERDAKEKREAAIAGGDTIEFQKEIDRRMIDMNVKIKEYLQEKMK